MCLSLFKGGLISGDFSLWLQSSKNVSTTILSIFSLELRIDFGTFFGRLEPTWKNFLRLIHLCQLQLRSEEENTYIS